MSSKKDPLDTLGEAYEKMYERTAAGLHSLKEKSSPVFHNLVDEAKEKAIELGELTEQEAEKLAKWLKRDIDDAANYLSDTGRELKDWLSFETNLLESVALEMMLKVSDKTTIALLKLKEKVSEKYAYHTGEVTAAGTLVCDKCSEQLNFYKAGKIPPCPKCHGTAYHRKYK
jgi:DNA-binding ferritin-like protein